MKNEKKKSADHHDKNGEGETELEALLPKRVVPHVFIRHRVLKQFTQ